MTTPAHVHGGRGHSRGGSAVHRADKAFEVETIPQATRSGLDGGLPRDHSRTKSMFGTQGA